MSEAIGETMVGSVSSAEMGDAIGGRVAIEEVVGIGDGLALEVEAAGRDVNEEEGEIGTTQPDSSALMTEREISISVSKVLAE